MSSTEAFLRFPGVFAEWPANAAFGRAILLCEQLSTSAEFHEFEIEANFHVTDETRLHLVAMAPPAAGTYRINCILFFREEESHLFYRIHCPFNFSPLYFDCTSEHVTLRADSVDCERKRDAILAAMAVGDLPRDGNFCDVVFICRDALLSTGSRVGPVEIRPLFPHGIEDLTTAIQHVATRFGFHDAPPATVQAHINRAPDRRSPLFTVRFPRAYFDPRIALLSLHPFLRRVLGVLCLNRSSYATVLGGICVSRRSGTKIYHYFNLNSYYRGNLAMGPVANERPDSWNKEYLAASRDELKSDVLQKLNAAHAETDLDTAYFRLWAILEAVAQAVRGTKHLIQVRTIIEVAYQPLVVRNAVKLTFHGESFTFDQLLQMWHAWRNLTAHQGGIVDYRAGRTLPARQEPGLRRYLTQFQAHGVPFEFGEDVCLLELQDVTRRVVRAYLEDRLGTSP